MPGAKIQPDIWIYPESFKAGQINAMGTSLLMDDYTIETDENGNCIMRVKTMTPNLYGETVGDESGWGFELKDGKPHLKRPKSCKQPKIEEIIEKFKEEMKLTKEQEDKLETKFLSLMEDLENKNLESLNLWQKQKKRLVELARKYSIETMFVLPPSGGTVNKDTIREIRELMLVIASKIPQATPDLQELRDKAIELANSIQVAGFLEPLNLQKFLLYLAGFDFGNQITSVWGSFLSQTLLQREFQSSFEELLEKATRAVHDLAFEEAYTKAKNEVASEIAQESKKLLDQWKKEELDRLYEEMWNKMFANKTSDKSSLKELVVSSIFGDEEGK